jgi:class 3 adenylate cyclase
VALPRKIEGSGKAVKAISCIRTLPTANIGPDRTARSGYPQAVGALNARRAGQGLPATDMYLGLNIGEVVYGSKERLDFTVIGPAVSEVTVAAALVPKAKPKP